MTDRLEHTLNWVGSFGDRPFFLSRFLATFVVTMKGFRVFLLFAAVLCLFSCHKEENVPSSGSETNLKEGTVAVTRVKVGGTNAVLDAATSTFTATLPDVTDFSSVQVVLTSDANVIRAGEQVLDPSGSVVDLSSPLTVRFIRNGIYKEYTIVARNTGLPVVRIETPGRKNITSKEVWMDGATLRIELPDGKVDYEGKMEIRGRGNSTWQWYPKKPYALRLAEKELKLTNYLNI